MLKGKQLQLLIQNIKDRVVNVPGVETNGLIPVENPGIEAIISRDAQRSVAEVESRLKLALYPKRKTDLPKTPREVYEGKVKYASSYKDSRVLHFPQWIHLTEEQQGLYGTPNLYVDGTLPWDMFTNAQKQYFSTQVIYVPNKAADAEKLDGKGRNHIKLNERNIIKVHSVELKIKNPSNNSLFMGRSYSDSEIIVYHQAGSIQLIPAMARAEMLRDGGSFLASQSTAYGLTIPRIPQIMSVDYTYGYEEIPLDLMDAVAMTAANRVFETVNISFTKGLLSYSVQGFSAQFGKGMYTEVMQRYSDKADMIFANYSAMSITGW